MFEGDSADTHAPLTLIKLLIALLKPCCQAGSFYCNKPYICECFFRPKGGPSKFSGENPHYQDRFFGGVYINRHIHFHLKHNSKCQNSTFTTP